MGIILIIIGFMIQRKLYITDHSNAHEDYMEQTNMFMINETVRVILTFLSFGLIIYGFIRLFS